MPTQHQLRAISVLLENLLKELESTSADRLQRRARHELPILIDDILKGQLSSETGETERET
jgi:hypothetical protein